VLSLIGKLGIIDPMQLILLWNDSYKYQIWRPITALLFFPVTPRTGFHFLINLYFLYSYSSRLESGMFFGRTADYLFMFVFCWLLVVIVGFMAPFYFLLEPMVLTTIYIWSQLNRETIVQFWFGMQFKAMYFPWVLVLFNLIVRGGVLMELTGIVVGHIYYFFTFQYPQEYGGSALLKTPEFFYRFFPNQRGFVSGFGQAPPARQPAAPSAPRFPGRGQTLGHQD
jgi:derlin-1